MKNKIEYKNNNYIFNKYLIENNQCPKSQIH